MALPAGLKAVERLPGQIAGPWGRFTAAVARLVEVRAAIGKAAVGAEVEGATEQAQANTEADELWRAVEGWLGRVAAPSSTTVRCPAPPTRRGSTRSSSAAGGAQVHHGSTEPAVGVDEAQDGAAGEGAGAHPGLRRRADLPAARGRPRALRAGVRVPRGAREEEAVVTDSRPEFQACKDCLRDFLLKVESYAEPTEPGSEAMSAFLLRPYLDMADELASAAPTRKPAGPPPPPRNPIEPTEHTRARLEGFAAGVRDGSIRV